MVVWQGNHFSLYNSSISKNNYSNNVWLKIDYKLLHNLNVSSKIISVLNKNKLLLLNNLMFVLLNIINQGNYNYA